nr:MAG: replication associated protein [Cressdnaviricota sp.]
MGVSQQSKRWCFTLNNPTDLECEVVCSIGASDECVYLICADEVGECGTPHLQGYVVFNRNFRFKKVTKLLPRAHFLVAKGSSADNKAYCSKSGNAEEYGVCPVDSRISSQSNVDIWATTYELAKAGRIDECAPVMQIRYYRALERIRDVHAVRPVLLSELRNFWLWGPTASGKTSFCFEHFPDHYIKMKNKWWDDYKGEAVVCIQEFGKLHLKLSEHLKEWADHYPVRVEYKGGTRVVRSKVLIVTSNYSPESIFEEDEVLLPLLRRFNVYNFPGEVPDSSFIKDLQEYSRQ